MCDIEIDDIGNGCDGCFKALDVDDGITHGVEVVDADVRVVEQIGVIGVANEVILGTAWRYAKPWGLSAKR